MNETAKANRHDNIGRAESLASVASDTLRSGYEEMRTRVSDLRDRARYYSDEVGHAVSEHPFYALVGATVVGFLLGALIARRS